MLPLPCHGAMVDVSRELPVVDIALEHACTGTATLPKLQQVQVTMEWFTAKGFFG